MKTQNGNCWDLILALGLINTVNKSETSLRDVNVVKSVNTLCCNELQQNPLVYNVLPWNDLMNSICRKPCCKERGVHCYYWCTLTVWINITYTECPRRNVPNFGRVFLMLNYTDITQNTYIQSWTVTEIMAREVWNFDSCYTLTDYQIHIKTGRNMWFL